MQYRFGHVIPWWDDSFKTLDYQYYPMNQGLLDEWIAQGYTNLELNCGIYARKTGPMPDYAEPFSTLNNWEHVELSFSRLNTCEALPMHKDHYVTYRKIHNITDTSTIWRTVVFLEDWKSGHYFEIDGQPFVNWKAGNCVTWNYDVPHFAGNFGIEPRYTIQITGIQK
jgi:hypothetical protein